MTLQAATEILSKTKLIIKPIGTLIQLLTIVVISAIRLYPLTSKVRQNINFLTIPIWLRQKKNYLEVLKMAKQKQTHFLTSIAPLETDPLKYITTVG